VPNCDAKKGDVRLFDALALGGWIAGAGVGAVAIVMWTSGGSSGSDGKSSAAPQPAPRAELVPGIGTLTLRGTF
jgi:hypothetical protein